MAAAELAVNFFVALFALLDPVGSVPLFAAATSDESVRSRRRIALYIALFVLAFLTFFYVTGLAILEFFGISLGAFRIAGGVLLFLLGLEMAREDFLATFQAAEQAVDGPADFRIAARRRFEQLIVPFGIPFLIGPGAISAVVVYAGEANQLGWVGGAAGFGAIFAAALAMLACFLLAGPIGRLLGRVGMVIVVRILGLVLCAMAVQFVIAGLSEVTVDFIAPAAAAPYGH
jgi:multiple antibiotic resistance protein